MNLHQTFHLVKIEVVLYQFSHLVNQSLPVEQLLKQLKYYGISSTTTASQELIKESQIPSGNASQNKSYVQQLREFKAQQAEEAAKLELERLQRVAARQMQQNVNTSGTKTFKDFFIITNNSRLYVQNINGGVIRE